MLTLNSVHALIFNYLLMYKIFLLMLHENLDFNIKKKTIT